MQRQIGAMLLVAGTCIGSGMIALPIVLAKIGILPSILLMAFTWFIMYYTSLVNIELNLQAGRGISLGSLGRLFSGKKAELVGFISLKLLSYSLLAVFISGGSSVLQELLASKLDLEYSFISISTFYSLIAMAFLLLPIKLIDYVNRLLFVCLLSIVAVLIAALAMTINWTELPLLSEQYSSPSAWATLLPVVFTSFGFQVIFHTAANYCNMNQKVLKNAFKWGSLIPTIVYILWTCSILGVVYRDNPQFYAQMAMGKVGIGELIQVLSSISKWQSVQLLIWLISLLAIATSVLGVGLGLCDSIKNVLAKKVQSFKVRNLLASALAIIPAYLVVLFVPNAFITVLGFAGMILAIIAILLPIYLLHNISPKKFHYPELRRKLLLFLSIAFGLTVIVSELFNFFIDF